LRAVGAGISENRNTARNEAARIVAMLRSSAGATIAAITVATGWQQHSVRDFLPGWSARSLDLILSLNLPHQGWQGFTG